MEPKILIQQCQIILNQAIRMGQTPVAFQMNSATRKFIGDAIRAYSKPSRFTKLKRRLLRKKDPVLTSLFKLPVMENEYLPDFQIALSWAPTAAISHGVPMPTASTPVDTPPPAVGGVPRNPFISDEKVKADKLSEAPTLQDISSTDQRTGPTPTDVLIRGLERVEAISQVIVIRKYPNGDVDMSMSCNPDEAVGIVQKAQMWLAHNGH